MERLLKPVPAPNVARRGRRVSPAVHGAVAAAYSVTARAGSLTTLAAMLVLGGAVAASADGTVPSGPAATTVTLQDPAGTP
ncbi:hypothetical protein LWC33_13790 [Pseudonocardia sp. RS11V-5]|uniref:hypothetical protein n=1 Tax=Pseudonocardia terrae TaxID=2905831 RepID=UPI001E376180|nr:hypothetical protein [Pseudonocardia terrae]MCE3552528.1 hypothetical protein [Pseudonocardia terrae]